MIEKELKSLSLEEMRRFKDEYPVLAKVFLAMVANVTTNDEKLNFFKSAFSETSAILKDYDWKIDSLKHATDRLIRAVDPEGYKEMSSPRPLEVMPFYGVNSKLDIN